MERIRPRRALAGSIALAAAIALLGLEPAGAQPVRGPAPARERARPMTYEPYVVNGRPADAADWPFLAGLLRPGVADPFQAQFCGGAVIAATLVVTAAHCVEDLSAVDVLVGTSVLAPGRGVRLRSTQIRVHPAWNPADASNDIAVVRLPAPAGVDTVAVARDKNRRRWGEGSAARVAGWGCDLWSNFVYECYDYPTSLMEVTVPIRAAAACADDPGVEFDDRSMLCAGTRSTAGAAPDACFGDSGGPLVVGTPRGPILAGLVSHGPGCGAYPGVYTRVASFASWLAGFGIGVGTAGATGYRLAAADGGVFSFGTAGFYGSAGALPLRAPIVAMVPTPTGRGYYLAAADGGVFTYGDASYRGSAGMLPLRAPIVAMAVTPTGRGYYLGAADGGVFAYGDARFRGSAGTLPLRAPVVAMGLSPTGAGYYLAAADGGVFTYGDAAYRGSAGTLPLRAPIVDVALTPTGRGYYLAAADGGIFTFGDARYRGSAGGLRLVRPVVDLAVTPTGRGYYLAASDGGIFTYGDAPFLGSTGSTPLAQPIVGMAAV